MGTDLPSHFEVSQAGVLTRAAANFSIETNMAHRVLDWGFQICQEPHTLRLSRQAGLSHARPLRMDWGLPVMLPTHLLGPDDGSAGKPALSILGDGER